MKLIRISAPADEPVSLDEAKEHLRITMDDEDATILLMIAHARDMIERVTRRAFVSQVWEMRFPCFPHGPVEVPLPPCISVDSIAVLNSAGVPQTMDPSDYWVIEGGDWHAEILSSTYWPTMSINRPDAVRIQFTAGYPYTADADTAEQRYAENVPAPIKQAILLEVASRFENRQSVLLTPTRQELAILPGVADILQSFIIPSLG